MTGQVLDIETICPKCDYEFTVTYVSHEAEAAEERCAQLEAQLAGAAQTIVMLTRERDEARRELQQAQHELNGYHKLQADIDMGIIELSMPSENES